MRQQRQHGGLMCGFLFVDPFLHRIKHYLKATSAPSFINPKVFLICKGLIWLQISSCQSRGPTLAPFSLGRPAFHSRTRLPAGHDSPHLSRAHRSQTPLTQHAPYSLLAVTTRDSSRTKGGKSANEHRIAKVALRVRRRDAVGAARPSAFCVEKKEKERNRWNCEATVEVCTVKTGDQLEEASLKA